MPESEFWQAAFAFYCMDLNWPGLGGGIGALVVLRDLHAIARRPERPPDRLFGRPIFQGLSFHDTPEQPLPLAAMRFVDTTAPSGKKHTYTVIALSSGGTRSEPSPSVSVP